MEGYTALHLAAERCHEENIAILAEHDGSLVNKADEVCAFNINGCLMFVADWRNAAT